MIQGRVPPHVERSIRKLMSSYASNITSVLCQFPSQQVSYQTPQILCSFMLIKHTCKELTKIFSLTMKKCLGSWRFAYCLFLFNIATCWTHTFSILCNLLKNIDVEHPFLPTKPAIKCHYDILICWNYFLWAFLFGESKNSAAKLREFNGLENLTIQIFGCTSCHEASCCFVANKRFWACFTPNFLATAFLSLVKKFAQYYSLKILVSQDTSILSIVALPKLLGQETYL